MKISRIGKKAGEKLLSIWWFFIIGVIGGFIVLGVIIYYSTDTNTNSTESSILANKLASCFIFNGKLNNGVFNKDFSLFKECNLDEKMFGFGSNLYFNISIYDSDKLIKDFINGSGTFEKDCKIGEEVSGKYFPSCFKQSYFVEYENKVVRVDILGGSNQQGSKISLN